MAALHLQETVHFGLRDSCVNAFLKNRERIPYSVTTYFLECVLLFHNVRPLRKGTVKHNASCILSTYSSGQYIHLFVG